MAASRCTYGNGNDGHGHSAMDRGVSRYYTNANMKGGKPSKHVNYGKSKLKYGIMDNYSIVRCLGHGKFSIVFLVICDKSQKQYTLKSLMHVQPEKITREIHILKHVQRGPNVVHLFDVLCNPDTQMTYLVLEYVHVHEKSLADVYLSMKYTDVQLYMDKILRGLDYCHKRGVMHRDIKPTNIMIDTYKKELRIIDFGLAEYYIPGTEYHVRVGTKGFKAPELLVGYRCYDYAVDMWALGCVFASIVFKQKYVFSPEDNLGAVIDRFGYKEVTGFVYKYKPDTDETVSQRVLSIDKNKPRIPWQKNIDISNYGLCTVDSLQLLDCLLCFDPQMRSSAREALTSGFFL
jgi:casein kinase II subunit alpha